MDFNKLGKELKSGKLKPVYFFTGEEPYFIDRLVEISESSIIPDEEKDFNCQICYGKDQSCKIIVESCRQYPFFGEKKLVLVKDAQDMKDWDLMDSYLKNPIPSTVLILSYKNKKPDGRSSWVKNLKENHVFFESKPLYENQIPAFITELADAEGLKLDQDAVIVLSEYIGNDLSHIYNEIQKLKLNSISNSITKEMIADLIGISREYNVFELCKAFSKRDRRKAYFIAQNLAMHIKSNPLVLTISSLYNHFNKILGTKSYSNKSDSELMSILKVPFPMFLKEYREASKLYTEHDIESILHIIRIFDLKSKGVDSGNTNQENTLLEMVLHINQI